MVGAAILVGHPAALVSGDVEVYRGIAGIIWRRRRPILPLKTLLTRPGFDEGPIHTEVLVRE